MRINISHDYSKERGSTELHQRFKKEFTISVSKEFDSAMVIPYDIGFVRAYSNPDICYKIGQDGVLDTIVVTPKATLWFDMKTGMATLSKEQRAFKERIFQIHGEHRAFKISSVEQGLKIIRFFYDK